VHDSERYRVIWNGNFTVIQGDRGDLKLERNSGEILGRYREIWGRHRDIPIGNLREIQEEVRKIQEIRRRCKEIWKKHRKI
jgi:hypothetical protein